MTTLTKKRRAALRSAVTAYDAARCAASGDKPMSEENRDHIAPMIEAAITAYLSALEGEPVAWMLYHPTHGGRIFSQHPITDGDRSLGWTDKPLYAVPPPAPAIPEGWKPAAEADALLDAADEVLESMDDSGLARNGVDLVPLRNAAAKFKAAMLAAAWEAPHE